MKNKPLPVGSRHPKVVMIVDNDEDTTGASNILVSHIEEYRTIQLNEETTDYLLQIEPIVILFALGTVEKSVEYYKCLVDEHQLNHLHYSVILCNNKDSALAFRCCMKGFFDNYFVYQPLYEKLRLLMIVQNGLNETRSATALKNENDELFEQIDQDLSLLIEEGSKCKQNILNSVKSKREDIIQSSEKSIQSKELDISDQPSEEVISSIKEEHLTPLLAHLEEDIKAGLDNLLAQLLSKQTAIKETPKVKPQKQKGLITHVPSIKKRPVPPVTPGEHDDELPPITNTASNDNEIDLPQDDPVILIVEDNNLYREMIGSVLTKENYNIDEAEDGLCALKKIKEKHYDLILMDLFMPNLDGLNATKKIRQLSGGRDIPVIALTGNKNKEIVKKWANFGLKGYIMKPSTKTEILSVVKKILQPKTTNQAV